MYTRLIESLQLWIFFPQNKSCSMNEMAQNTVCVRQKLISFEKANRQVLFTVLPPSLTHLNWFLLTLNFFSTSSFFSAFTIRFDSRSTRPAHTICCACLSFNWQNFLYFFSSFFMGSFLRFQLSSSASLDWSSPTYFREIDWNAWETSNVCCVSKPLRTNSISTQTSSYYRCYTRWPLRTSIYVAPSHPYVASTASVSQDFVCTHIYKKTISYLYSRIYASPWISFSSWSVQGSYFSAIWNGYTPEKSISKNKPKNISPPKLHAFFRYNREDTLWNGYSRDWITCHITGNTAIKRIFSVGTVTARKAKGARTNVWYRTTWLVFVMNFFQSIVDIMNTLTTLPATNPPSENFVTFAFRLQKSLLFSRGWRGVFSSIRKQVEPAKIELAKEAAGGEQYEPTKMRKKMKDWGGGKGVEKKANKYVRAPFYRILFCKK